MCKNNESTKNTSATLWTADFTKITFATVISIIGAEAMTLPMSLLVFDRTQSTFLASLILVCGMLPDIILSVAVSPFIDRGSKKHWIVGIDCLFLLSYLAMAFYTWRYDFSYIVYVLFTLLTATLSVFYRLAYDAWYPDLIPVGMEQKGFAVGGTLYDLTVVVATPVASVIYTLVPMYVIFLFVAVTTTIAIFVEAQIKEQRRELTETTGGLRGYIADLKAGFSYLKEEHGVRNIFTYMSVSIGTGNGADILKRAYFQTAAALNVTMYGFIYSVYSGARIVTGTWLYKKEVPVKRRFSVVKFVYAALNALDALVLFLPYPLMLADFAVQGGLANVSYTLRETATKSYIPEDKRARVGAIFNMMISVSSVLINLAAGVIGEVMSLRAGVVLLAAVNAAVMVLFIYLPGRTNRVVYEAVRTKTERA